MRKLTLLVIAACVPVLQSHGTILVNGGFEDGLTGWTTLPGANSNYAAQGDEVHSGLLALKTGPSGWAAAMQNFDTIPGQPYVATFWCKGENMYWGINSGEWWPERDPVDPVGTFHKNTYSFTAPTASTRIYFGSESAAGYYDSADLKWVPEPGSTVLLLSALAGLGRLGLRRRG